MRAAPSSIEYSECTCKWTNEPSPGWMLPGISAPPKTFMAKTIRASKSNQAVLLAPASAGSGEAQQAPTLVAPSQYLVCDAPLTTSRKAQPQSVTTFSIVRILRTVELTPMMSLNLSASLLLPMPWE